MSYPGFALLIAAGLLSISCAKKEDKQAPAEAPDTLSIMEFRPAPEGSSLLAERFTHPDGNYSIRPPAGWKRVPASKGARGMRHGASFRDAGEGGGLDTGLASGGPAELEPGPMKEFTEGYLRELRQSGLFKLIGTDLFHFKHYRVIQVLSRAGTLVNLQLLVFREPGEFLNLTFVLGDDHYGNTARAIEASIESLVWPSSASREVDTVPSPQ